MTSRWPWSSPMAAAPPTELDAALSDAGFAVTHRGVGEVMIRPEIAAAAELMLVSASLGLKQVALLDQGLSGAGSPPAFVVFPQGDYAALEACARSGFDYVMPPFLAALLEERVASCRERSQLSTVVEEIAATVKLREYERDLSDRAGDPGRLPARRAALAAAAGSSPPGSGRPARSPATSTTASNSSTAAGSASWSPTSATRASARRCSWR